LKCDQLPSFDDAKIELAGGDETVHVKIHYIL
jgi:uncharacterized protein (DUF2141 family)